MSYNGSGGGGGNSIFRLESVKKALQPIFVNHEEQENTQSNGQSNVPSLVNPNEDELKNKQSIQRLRNQVMRRSAESPDNYYADDVLKILTNEWSVARFIPDDHQSDACIDKISESIDSCLRWRKEYGIREIRMTSFPSEFFTIGLFELGTNPLNGKSVVYIRGNKYKKISELTEYFQRFGSCLYETLDTQLVTSGNQRLTAFLDLKGVTLENVDVPIFRHFLELMFNYFPNILMEAFVVDVSWFLRPIVFLILKVIPERFTKCVRIVSRKELMHAVDPMTVPRELGGLLQTEKMQPSDGQTISLQDFVHLHHIPQHVVAKAKKIYKL